MGAFDGKFKGGSWGILKGSWWILGGTWRFLAGKILKDFVPKSVWGSARWLRQRKNLERSCLRDLGSARFRHRKGLVQAICGSIRWFRHCQGLERSCA